MVQEDAESSLERYNIVQVKPLLVLQDSATSFIPTLHRTFSAYATDKAEILLEIRALERDNHSRSSALHRKRSNVPKQRTNSPVEIKLIEIVDKYDPITVPRDARSRDF